MNKVSLNDGVDINPPTEKGSTRGGRQRRKSILSVTTLQHKSVEKQPAFKEPLQHHCSDAEKSGNYQRADSSQSFRVKVVGVKIGEEIHQIRNEILKRNEWLCSEGFLIQRAYADKRFCDEYNRHGNAIVRCDKSNFVQIMNYGSIAYDGTFCVAHNYTRINQCFKCQQFGHISA